MGAVSTTVRRLLPLAALLLALVITPATASAATLSGTRVSASGLAALLRTGPPSAVSPGGQPGIGPAYDRLVVGVRVATEATADASAYSSTSALNLSRQLASESQVAGAGTSIAGAGTSTTLRVAEQLASEYGGDPYAWAKMTSDTFTDSDGFQFSTHWYENLETGQQVEWKTVLGR